MKKLYIKWSNSFKSDSAGAGTELNCRTKRKEFYYFEKQQKAHGQQRQKFHRCNNIYAVFNVFLWDCPFALVTTEAEAA
jgi:hypothetical protein